MVDLDDTDLSPAEKAFRARALVAAIDEDDFGDPDVERLHGDALELLDELAGELGSPDDG